MVRNRVKDVNYMILDIGCGAKTEPHFLNTKKPNIRCDWEKYGPEITVQGDIQILPFKNRSFNVVHASHILEHVDAPLFALKELYRVAKYLVIIRVPNAKFFRWHNESKNHIYSWNPNTLTNLLRKVPFKHIVVSETYRRTSLKWIRHLFAYFTVLFHGKNELLAFCYK